MNKQEQKKHLIDLMNMKTIEEVAEEELNFIHNSVRCIDFDLGFKNGAIIGANYQKQIYENLIKNMYTKEEVLKVSLYAYNFGCSANISSFNEWFQIFQSERNK